jgi:outer membrane translocation and assembly module TamA
MDRFSIEPAFVWRFGPQPDVVEDSVAEAEAEADSTSAAAAEPALEPMRATVSVGPVLHHTSTRAAAESPFALAQPIGFESLWQTGAAARFQLAVTDGRVWPRRGVRFTVSVAAYPAVLDMPGAAADAAAEVNAYVPLIGEGLRLAVRAGALGALGDHAAWDAPKIGGKATLRGSEFQRFAGDAAAYGGAELRAPLGEIELLTRGELGVFALADAGRVWVAGKSPGGWHAAYGGGISFETLGRALSVALASGEREQLYIWLGFPF